MTIRFQSIGLICVAAGSLCAQQGRIAGPTSGLVFDPHSRGLRQVIGIPGAGTIGAPVGFAKDLTAAWVSPSLDSAIGMATDGSLRIYRIGPDSTTEISLDGIDKGPQNVIFSPSGSAALLQSARGMHVVTGLPDAPKVAGTIERTATPRSRLSASGGRPSLQRLSLAISDDGAYVLSSIGGTVQVHTTSGENRKLADVAVNAVVAFAAASHDAAVADSNAGVVLFRDLAGAATPSVIAPSDSKTASFSGMAFSVDGRRLHLASAAAHSVTTFDVQAGSATTAFCECSPSGLVRMDKVFRLTEFSADPLWLLDGDQAEPRIVFVPAATPAN
jgi:hypothetical protein